MPGIASSAPAVLAATLAQATERMRVGSGGVMLPNHAPLVVAEQFGMLEGLHPGRIDLGIGRAPGTDGHTAMALRRQPDALSDDDFPAPPRRALRLLQRRVPARAPLRRDHGGPRQGRQARHLAARLERLLGAARRHARPALLVRPPLHGAEHAAGARALPLQLPAVRSPVRAARDGRRRRDPRRGRQARPLPGGPLADGDGAASPGQPDPHARSRNGAPATPIRPPRRAPSSSSPAQR